MGDNKENVIIVGTGAAGLFCALNLPDHIKVTLISKDRFDKNDSYLAQGGICVLRDDTDYDNYFEDTLKAGHYKNDKKAVEVMIKESREVINNLIDNGVDFEKENNQLKYTLEGAHSAPRILYHEDLTGKEITSKLFEAVCAKKNVTMLEYLTMIDIIAKDNKCSGIVVRDKDNNIKQMYADYVVLACGGIGGLYESSTNYPHLTGDAIAIAIKNDIEVQDLDYVQIHPTSLYSEKKGRRFLISESVRGEGAYLYNANMERFVDELLPRDVLSKKIKEQMVKEGSKHVWLSIAHLDSEEIIKRFPNIYKKCLEEGYDITKEPIPVTPAQHYFMGGIKVDINSKTSMEHLYAAGETSCNGVHGANRLASNSLLETLVFSKRCARHIVANYEKNSFNNIVGVLEPKTYERYQNAKELEKEYKTIVIDNIEEFGVKREKENK